MLFRSEEINWLNTNKNKIVYAPNPGWPPCDFIDKDGIHKGIIADYIRIFETKTGIRFQRKYLNSWNEIITGLKDRSIDFVGGIHESEERKQFLNFTDQIFSIPLVLIVTEDFNHELSESNINKMKLACAEGYSSIDFIRLTYPNAEIIECKDDLEALFKTSMGIADGAVIDLMVASHLVETYGFSNLDNALELDFAWKLAFGIRNDYPELSSILNKVLSTISVDERKAKIGRAHV